MCSWERSFIYVEPIIYRVNLRVLKYNTEIEIKRTENTLKRQSIKEQKESHKKKKRTATVIHAIKKQCHDIKVNGCFIILFQSKVQLTVMFSVSI